MQEVIKGTVFSVEDAEKLGLKGTSSIRLFSGGVAYGGGIREELSKEVITWEEVRTELLQQRFAEVQTIRGLSEHNVDAVIADMPLYGDLRFSGNGSAG